MTTIEKKTTQQQTLRREIRNKRNDKQRARETNMIINLFGMTNALVYLHDCTFLAVAQDTECMRSSHDLIKLVFSQSYGGLIKWENSNWPTEWMDGYAPTLRLLSDTSVN